jgi:hypothetical protein
VALGDWALLCVAACHRVTNTMITNVPIRAARGHTLVDAYVRWLGDCEHTERICIAQHFQEGAIDSVGAFC